MKKLLILLALIAIIPLMRAETPSPDQVATTLKRSADWQLANPSGISIIDSPPFYASDPNQPENKAIASTMPFAIRFAPASLPGR